MKVRKGFVSNSSSSSFIAALSRSEYELLIRNLDAMQRGVMEAWGYDRAGDVVVVEFLEGEAGDDNPSPFTVYERAVENGFENDKIEAAKKVMSKDKFHDYVVDALQGYSDDDLPDICDVIQSIEEEIRELAKDGRAIVKTMEF